MLPEHVKENLQIAREVLNYHAQDAVCPLTVKMSSWLIDDNGNEYDLCTLDVIRQNVHTCNTAACALGHIAILLGESEEHRQFNPLPSESFHEYGTRLFCPDGTNTSCFIAHSDFGNWLFSATWSNIDDTLQGIIKRFDYVIENGKVPDWFSSTQNKSSGVFAAEYNRFYEGIVV